MRQKRDKVNRKIKKQPKNQIPGKAIENLEIFHQILAHPLTRSHNFIRFNKLQCVQNVLFKEKMDLCVDQGKCT